MAQHTPSISDDLVRKLHEQITHMGEERHNAVKVDRKDRLMLYNTLYDEAVHFRSLFPARKRPKLPPRKLYVLVSGTPSATGLSQSVKSVAKKKK